MLVKQKKRKTVWGFFRKKSMGIQNQAALSDVSVSVYWFIWDIFLMMCIPCSTRRFIKKPFASNGEKLVLFLSCPYCHKRFQTGLCLFLAWPNSSLSHLPTGHKSLLFEDNWMYKEHEATCTTVMHHRLTADILYNPSSTGIDSSFQSAPGVFEPQMRA